MSAYPEERIAAERIENYMRERMLSRVRLTRDGDIDPRDASEIRATVRAIAMSAGCEPPDNLCVRLTSDRVLRVWQPRVDGTDRE